MRLWHVNSVYKNILRKRGNFFVKFIKNKAAEKPFKTMCIVNFFGIIRIIFV